MKLGLNCKGYLTIKNPTYCEKYIPIHWSLDIHHQFDIIEGCSVKQFDLCISTCLIFIQKHVPEDILPTEPWKILYLFIQYYIVSIYFALKANKQSPNNGSMKFIFFNQMTEANGKIILWYVENLKIVDTYSRCQLAQVTSVDTFSQMH